MPFDTCEDDACAFGANVEYITNESRGCFDDNWWHGCSPTTAAVVGLQSRSKFAAFSDEEFISTAEERAVLAARAPADAPAIIVGEDRSRPIRMRKQVPYTWANKQHLAHFQGSAQPGEKYTFQLGVWAHRQS
eukprot:gb/GFBE01050524.1/.p1 GENE.gb/GFBE01050524.1/~~gb/GFBE01050524.1/.p1  ORF type:complete len:133 (+),score=13.87 gb/GFBE01050524.1/:1-399(+)